MTTQPRTFTARAPEVPPAKEDEYETVSVFPGSLSLNDQAQLDGTNRSTTVKRRTVPAEPTAVAPGGSEKYWPLWVDVETGEPCHPRILCHDLGTGAAQLDPELDPAEVHRIVAWLRRTALLTDEQTWELEAPIAAERRALKAQVAENLQPSFTPDGQIRTYTAQELCEMFKLHNHTFRRWVREGRFPKPIQGTSSHGARWDARVVERWVTGTTSKPTKPKYDFQDAS